MPRLVRPIGDRDLDVLIAEKLMGCKPATSFVGPTCDCGNGWGRHAVDGSVPAQILYFTSDPVACRILKDRLRQTGIWFAININPEGTYAPEAYEIEWHRKGARTDGTVICAETEEMAVARLAQAVIEAELA